MMTDRHQNKDYEENTRDTCRYCHRTPSVWQQMGNEKVCGHCGTRVYSPTFYILPALLEPQALKK